MATPAQDHNLAIARALQWVAQKRGLAPLRSVAGRWVKRDELLRRVTDQLSTQTPPYVLVAQREILVALGSAPPDFDYEASILGLMSDQLAGFYDPGEQALYVASDLSAQERSVTLIHELAHALQDQHFGLLAHTRYREDMGDADGAVHALAEGDATSAMLEAIQGGDPLNHNDETIQLMIRSSAELGSGSQIPAAVKRSMAASYDDGLAFVHWARRRGGWKAVDEIWRRLPQSTEQVLHPEKWISGERPEVVPVPVGPVKALYHDVLGEQVLRIIFEDWMPRRTAVEAASGWAGDRIAVFQETGGFAVALRVRWDHPNESMRGAVAFARGILRAETVADLPDSAEISREVAEAAIVNNELCRTRKTRGPFALVRAGREVAIVAGPSRLANGHRLASADCEAALIWARALR